MKTLKIKFPPLFLTNKECKDLVSKSVFVANPHQTDYFYFNLGYVEGYINEDEIFVENNEIDYQTKNKKKFKKKKMEVIKSYEEKVHYDNYILSFSLI